MNFYVGGANAAGKSTIMRHLAAMAPEIEIIHGTSMLMDELGIPHDYDVLRTWPQHKLRPHYQRAAMRIVEAATDTPRVFDSHYMYLRRGVTDRVVGDWISLFRGLVLIYSEPNASWERVRQDHAGRDRALFPVGSSEVEARAILTTYIAETKAEFERLAQRHHLPHIIIDNSRQTAEQSARQLLNFMRQTATPPSSSVTGS